MTARFHPLHRAAVALAAALALAQAGAQALDDSPPPTDDQARQTAATPTSTLVNQYSGLFGNTADTQAVIEALRTGVPVTFATKDASGNDVTTTITPPASGTGVGNVAIALALLQAQVNATPATETSADIANLLNQMLAARGTGQGWGQIAQSLGVKLGGVISAAKANARSIEARQANEARRQDRPSEAGDGRAASPAAASSAGNRPSGAGSASGGAGGGGGGRSR